MGSLSENPELEEALAEAAEAVESRQRKKGSGRKGKKGAKPPGPEKAAAAEAAPPPGEEEVPELVLEQEAGAGSAEQAIEFTAEARYRHTENLQKIAEKIVAKIEFTDRVNGGDVPEFLEAFYLAQRRYLENRKLFGDAREDKFHHEDKPKATP